MNKTIKNIEDLKSIAMERWTELEDIPTKYLSSSGIAARECYRNILWHLSFHDDIPSLKENEELMNLVNIPDKDPEYYNVARKFYRAIERLS